MEALEFLEKFISMNPDDSGSVQIEDFLRALRLKPCGLSEKIFSFVDIEKMGKITFKQFLLASNHIMKQPLFQRACEFSFVKCGDGIHDHILNKEFGDAIRLSIPDASEHDPIAVTTCVQESLPVLVVTLSSLRLHWASTLKAIMQMMIPLGIIDLRGLLLQMHI